MYQVTVRSISMVISYLYIDVHLLLTVIIHHNTILDKQSVSCTLKVEGNLLQRGHHDANLEGEEHSEYNWYGISNERTTQRSSISG